ncbi:acyltransferase [Bacillus sp. ISL-18]|uniref:acyltransferase family protein n=1 Tax=Bacillus sp. ISL-18 TaxID=2819118 RepID=UPI001BE71B77|nr:acyltransferase [Bacillus sp. ISL-18]MBT2657098.1 acyltransferase [Bacillus sp. ISL-18]
MNKRFYVLDSLRGLAALSVLLCHILLVTKIPILTFFFTGYSPLKVFVNGHSAVILFFILSGFVLSLPFIRGNNIKYHIFLIKRFFRIYLPYIVSVLFTIIFCYAFSRGGINELSSWFNNSWTESIKFNNIIGHIFMIGNFNVEALNSVYWSLVQEMRISLIFPLLALIILRFNWKWTLILGLTLSGISGLNNIFKFETSQGFNISYSFTLHYISLFLIGGLGAKNSDNLVGLYKKLSKSQKWILVIFSFVLYNYSGLNSKIAILLGIPYYSEILSDYSIALGAIIIVIISIGSVKFGQLLMLNPLKFLGKVSYSLYLFHLPVMFSLINIFYYALPMWFIYMLSVVLSLVISNIVWYLIEKPSINYGKLITSKMSTFGIKNDFNQVKTIK